MKMSYSTSIGLIGAAIFWYAGQSLAANAPQARAKPIALVAEEAIVVLDGEGKQLMSNVEYFSRRRDGSVVKSRRRADEKLGIRRIMDVAKRQSITIDPITESITTYVLTNEDIEALTSPLISCDVSPYFSRSSSTEPPMHGVPVSRFNGKMPGTGDTVKRWVADPELPYSARGGSSE